MLRSFQRNVPNPRSRRPPADAYSQPALAKLQKVSFLSDRSDTKEFGPEMQVTVHVKSKDGAVKSQLVAAAHRVISHFGDRLPNSRLLCFLDDEDPSSLKVVFGSANRGVYGA